MTKEDAISRQAMFNILVKYGIHESRIAEELEELPPVTPQPKTGHWIDLDEKSAVCSCCNRNNTLYGDFCKWCGAIMLETQEKREEVEEYAKEMTYRDAIYNALQGKCIPYRKATLIKLYKLLDMVEPQEVRNK